MGAMLIEQPFRRKKVCEKFHVSDGIIHDPASDLSPAT
jgi:hypothetical protein